MHNKSRKDKKRKSVYISGGPRTGGTTLLEELKYAHKWVTKVIKEQEQKNK